METFTSFYAIRCVELCDYRHISSFAAITFLQDFQLAKLKPIWETVGKNNHGNYYRSSEPY
jgi:hypothetical protein